jgi:hypothetical protein
MHDPDSHASLVAVRMLDEKEGWVSGGEMTNAFEGRFWHTLDGGDTWTKEVGCATIADLMRMVLSALRSYQLHFGVPTVCVGVVWLLCASKMVVLGGMIFELLPRLVCGRVPIEHARINQPNFIFIRACLPP